MYMNSDDSPNARIGDQMPEDCECQGHPIHEQKAADRRQDKAYRRVVKQSRHIPRSSKRPGHIRHTTLPTTIRAMAAGNACLFRQRSAVAASPQWSR